MLKKKVQDALNAQLIAETYSSYLYLSMSADLEDKGLSGFAEWMRIQAQEELFHAMKFYDFIVERGGCVRLEQIDAPPHQWKTPLAIFEAAYRHELKVTGLINKLVDLAIKEKDHATNNFLQWFVNEQVEEEASADEMVRRLKLIGKDGRGLYMLDKEVGARPPLFAFPVKE